MTFTEIQTRVTDYLRLSSTEADTRVGNAINQHYRRITSLLGLNATRFTTISQTTTNGQSAVTFAEIEKIDRIIDTTDSNSIRLLQEVGIHEIRSTQPRTGEPLKWALKSTDADSVVVILDTLPQTTYTLQADGTKTLSALSGSDEPVFPESFHDILVNLVIVDELRKKGDLALAREYERTAKEQLSDLRFHLADSSTYATRQGGGASPALSGGSGGGAGSVGGTAYTQSALLTFDRNAGVVPFAVAQADAPYVPNLGAEFLGNITTDRLIGRDTAGTGESEQLTVGNGLAFTGSGGVGIADEGVTYARMQHVTATSRVLGRNTAGAGDVEEVTLTQLLDFIGSAAQGDLLYRGASAWARLGAGTSGQFLKTQGSAANPAWANVNAPTTQVFTSSSGTYTTPAGVTAIRVRLVGGGGGGGASGANNGAAGGNTTFSASSLQANGGSGGANGGSDGGAGGAGGAASNGYLNVTGNVGVPGGKAASSPPGGTGGAGIYGGAGAGGALTAAGGAATGGGAGGGGGGAEVGVVNSGGGGGAGGYCELWVNAPAATYTYAVGAGGAGGAAGTYAGGNGAAGLVIVEEFYG